MIHNATPKTGLIYVCKICNLVLLPHQLIPAKENNKMVCPQDGGAVKDISQSKRGKRFLQMYNRWK